MPTDAQVLVDAAKCYGKCIPPGDQLPALIYLTGQILKMPAPFGFFIFTKAAEGRLTGGGNPKSPPPGDLASRIIFSVVGDITGKTVSPATLDIFSSADDVGRIYVRNTSLWSSGIDLTCIPASSTGGGSSFNGVLVAPDILIQANHSHYSGTFYFCDPNNAVFSAVVISGQQVGSTDIWVSRLSAPLPGSIKPAKVLPVSAYTGGAVNILQTDVVNQYMLCAFSSEDRTVQVGRLSGLQIFVGVMKCDYAPADIWYSPVVGGDSGSPVFLFIDGEAVALCTWYQSNMVKYSVGPSISENVTGINAAISALGSGYQLATKDLSSYSNYPTYFNYPI